MLTIQRKCAISLIIFLVTMFVPLGNHFPNSVSTIESRRNHSIANYIPENSWHHDCSNLTDIDGVGNDSWIPELGYNVTGSMNSSGSYFYADDYGFGPFGHGPLRYHALSSPIRVSQFISLEAELELEPYWDPAPSSLGHIMVILYDDFEEEVMTLHAAQVWDPYPTQVEALARWRFSNGTKIETPIDNVHQEPYRDTLKFSQNETGLFASFPGIGNYSILAHDEVESNRVIEYIAIYIGATFTFPPTDVLRVHDLLLSYDSTAPVIQGPDDIHYDEFTTGHSIIWNVSESNPSRYSLYINDSLDSSGPWEGSDFTIDIDNQSLGVHNYTLLVTDAGGNVACDTVLVFVHDGGATSLTETTSTSSTTTSVLPSSTTSTSGLFGLDIQTVILIAGGVALLIVLVVCIRVRRR
ncbi:MAG: hypothetical protein RTU30_03735 [Candidatus Thorarchaeota archaeon]